MCGAVQQHSVIKLRQVNALYSVGMGGHWPVMDASHRQEELEEGESTALGEESLEHWG